MFQELILPDQTYIIKDKLGKGFSSEVYLARKTDVKEYVVIKHILPNSDLMRNMALNEIDILSRLSESCVEYISCYIDSYISDQDIYIITKYLYNHIDLNYWCKKENNLYDDIKKGKDINKFVTIFTSLCQGLRYIHRRGVAHRDIKPANLLINIDTYSVKYIDFGMACMQTACEKSNIRSGTPNYIDPCLYKERKVDLAFLKGSDIYSLGCVFSYLSIRETPFSVFYKFCKNLKEKNLSWKKQNIIPNEKDFEDIMTYIDDPQKLLEIYSKFYSFSVLERENSDIANMIDTFITFNDITSCIIDIENMLHNDNDVRDYPC
jgi:serine/threonine protein kinase